MTKSRVAPAKEPRVAKRTSIRLAPYSDTQYRQSQVGYGSFWLLSVKVRLRKPQR
jgi:hypothetical protein